MTIEEEKVYDTSASDSEVSDMITYINTLPANKIVLVGIKEDAAVYLHDNAYVAL